MHNLRLKIIIKIFLPLRKGKLSNQLYILNLLYVILIPYINAFLWLDLWKSSD